MLEHFAGKAETDVLDILYITGFDYVKLKIEYGGNLRAHLIWYSPQVQHFWVRWSSKGLHCKEHRRSPLFWCASLSRRQRLSPVRAEMRQAWRRRVVILVWLDGHSGCFRDSFSPRREHRARTGVVFPVLPEISVKVQVLWHAIPALDAAYMATKQV